MDELARWGPTIVALIGAAIAWGKMGSRVDGHDNRLDTVEERIETHSTKLEAQGIEIAKLTAWRDGYNAATTKLREG